MENKNIIIGGGVIVLIIVGWLSFMNNNAEMAKQAEKTINEINATSTESATVDTNANTNTNTNTNMTQITELKMEDSVVGTGAEAKAGDNVTVHYVGTLLDGTVFDASKPRGDQGFTFTLGAGQVIKGWDVGVAGMKVGGKRKLSIPSAMAYGNQAVGGVIPANSDLIFEVELLSTGK